MKKSSAIQISRRKFLKTAGCLTVGFSIINNGMAFTEGNFLDEELPRSIKQQPKINAWIEILEDGKVQILTGKMELGQGIRTAIAQVAADELDMNLNLVSVHLAETGRTPHEGYTAGSGFIENSAMSVRYAAASARQKLLQLAANKLKVDPGQLVLENGEVKLKGKNITLSFFEILEGKQIEDKVRLPVKLKPRDQYRLVGKAIPRKDIEKMVRGEQIYVQDLRFDSMVHARVIRPKGYKDRLKKLEEKQLHEQVPGILKVVVDGNFLGVIAKDEFQAVKAQRFLHQYTQWEILESLPTKQSLRDYIKSLPAESENVVEKGSVNNHFDDAALSVKVSYYKPYVMHASIGPSCAVALYDKEVLQIWTHSQGVYPLRESLKKMLKMTEEQLHIIGVPGSGCYGHNGADDVAADVALLAKAYPGKHVRLQWSREDEHGWEPYGSAMEMALEASLDHNGKIKAWKYDLWSDSHSTRPGGDAANLLAARYLKDPFEMSSS